MHIGTKANMAGNCGDVGGMGSILYLGKYFAKTRPGEAQNNV